MTVYIIQVDGEAETNPPGTFNFPYNAAGSRREADRLFREACLEYLPDSAEETATVAVYLYKTTLPNLSKKKLAIALLSEDFDLGSLIKELDSTDVGEISFALAEDEGGDEDYERATLKALRQMEGAR
jgi:hypothetical protein